MALIACHECGHQISRSAKLCPSCGAEPKWVGRTAQDFVFHSVVWLSIIAAAAVAAWFFLDSNSPYAMERAVSAKLHDPESAQFRGIRKSGNQACGEVNGKNRMGAYVGFQPFYAHETGESWLVIIDSDDSHVAREMCAKL